MDRLDLYKLFVCVVDSASFTRAATSLGLPRSSVSAAIRELELRVGARLLQRTTRKVAATADGVALYDRCLRLIADIEEAETLFLQRPATISGRIRVEVPSRIGRLIIAPALPAFLRQHPEIDIVLGSSDRSADLIGEGVDCALRVGGSGDSRLAAIELGKLCLVNVASRDYLDRHGTPQSPQDLDAHWMIGYAGSDGRVDPWEWQDERGLQQRALRARVTVNNAETYIACCLAGLGLIQVPAYDVAAPLAAGELVELMPAHRAAPMTMTLLYPPYRHLSRRLQVFTQWLQQILRPCTVQDFFLNPGPIRSQADASALLRRA